MTETDHNRAAAFLTEETRSKIAVLADAIVPAETDRPSATEARVHTSGMDSALTARPDLIDPLARVLDHVDEHGTDALSSADESDLTKIVELILVCYFMAPKARFAIDYPGQRVMPIAEGETEYYLSDGELVEPVLRRGSLWRSDGSDHQKPAQPAASAR
ncbi:MULTISPECIES: hypothetical protein [Rhodococcus erythropolis group]|uniref:hypothetical protein n=1 Tax=Rhodococcus erythropolis group TaxID=2840174 RepID=UPI001BEBD236|nr:MULTISPECIES: hypothetical protein [Rhodococcus erythropolis group]MBT2266090.1 hypothetical protein [Rhodococcus erythropolis]MBT2274267.1 hypothetical protein [Rhodococcus qingshengii]